MDGRRLRAGEGLAGGGGLALGASAFLPWYAAGSATTSAWEAFGLIDLVLALTGLLGVTLAVLAATRRSPAAPVAAGVVLIALSAVAILLATYRLLDQPGPDEAVDVRLGAYLGLGCLLAVAAGAWRSVADEHAGAAAPQPPVAARPAPPATPAGAATGRPGDPPAP